MAAMDKESHSVAEETVHAVVGWGAVALAYNWLAHFVNLLGSVLMPAREGGLLPMAFDFPLGPGHLFPVLWPVLFCFIIGFITYVILKWVCALEWVRAEISIRRCFRINPFGIVFCILVAVSVWVLRIVCRWMAYFISVPIWFCIVIWVWRLF